MDFADACVKLAKGSICFCLSSSGGSQRNQDIWNFEILYSFCFSLPLRIQKKRKIFYFGRGQSGALEKCFQLVVFGPRFDRANAHIPTFFFFFWSICFCELARIKKYVNSTLPRTLVIVFFNIVSNLFSNSLVGLDVLIKSLLLRTNSLILLEHLL